MMMFHWHVSFREGITCNFSFHVETSCFNLLKWFQLSLHIPTMSYLLPTFRLSTCTKRRWLVEKRAHRTEQQQQKKNVGTRTSPLKHVELPSHLPPNPLKLMFKPKKRDMNIANPCKPWMYSNMFPVFSWEWKGLKDLKDDSPTGWSLNKAGVFRPVVS